MLAASGSEHVSALASLCFCDRPAELIFRMQVGGVPDQFQCPHLETPFCHLNILKVRNAREIWRARTCDEENFRNVSSILDTVWIHRRGWDAAKWWSLHIPLHSDGAQLPQAIPQTATSGMASRVIWKRWVWLSFPSRPYRPDLGSTSLGNNLLQMHWLQQEYPVSTMPISSTQLWSSTWESNCGSYFHSLFLRLLLFPCWAWHNASGSEHVSALASLCFCDRPAESIFRTQVGGVPDQFQCPHLETPFCHLNILKVRNAREIWRARTCDEENFRNVSSILDTVWIHRRGWDAAKWWSLHIPLHSDGAQLPQAIPQTASSGMASRVIWKRWVWLSFQVGLTVRTWEAHHLETTCFRRTGFNKNTQYPQCQYLLPNCGAQPEKATVAHTFIPYF